MQELQQAEIANVTYKTDRFTINIDNGNRSYCTLSVTLLLNYYNY